MKTPTTSKTIISGTLVTLMSIFAIFVEFWELLSPEQMDLLHELIGPELLASVGALMIVLRVYTYGPLTTTLRKSREGDTYR